MYTRPIISKSSPVRRGRFGRNEIAIIGTTCQEVKALAFELTHSFFSGYKVGYVDADHFSSELEKELGSDSNSALSHGACTEFYDKITFTRLDFRKSFNNYELKLLFNDKDLVFVNGNHFKATQQILVLDPEKLEKLPSKLHKITNVKAILLKDGVSEIPKFIENHIGSSIQHIPVLNWENLYGIRKIIEELINTNKPPLNGLVLAGGLSKRMGGKDKTKLNFHGRSQREHVFHLLDDICDNTYMSCRKEQAKEFKGKYPYITDSFLGLGPLGALLSAHREHPDCSWLVVASDLPFVCQEALKYLISHRNESALATAFSHPTSGLPEPLLTIWEPQSYMTLLLYMSQGLNNLSEILMNCQIEQLKTPVPEVLANVDTPDELDEVIRMLSNDIS
ncbi:NTP transferase domain-containing protein [Limibacter armeniacum]|uniref:NTP transferase domain-containing protein n=1 Tax=Limibacter armeniacum TaxID=466084 RepID=UPI002FE64975